MNGLGVCIRECVYGNAPSTPNQLQTSPFDFHSLNECLNIVCECVYEYECMECKEEERRKQEPHNIHTHIYTPEEVS